MNIDQNIIFLIIGAVGVAVTIRFLGNTRKPPTDDFICARCRKKESYSPRTIEAWRQGFKKLYCQNCHQIWLRNNPQNRKQFKPSGRGCLSVLIIYAIIPVAIYEAAKYLF